MKEEQARVREARSADPAGPGGSASPPQGGGGSVEQGLEGGGRTSHAGASGSGCQQREVRTEVLGG